jgi:hypothetical protein
MGRTGCLGRKKVFSCSFIHPKMTLRVWMSFDPDMTCPCASHVFVPAISCAIARFFIASPGKICFSFSHE